MNNTETTIEKIIEKVFNDGFESLTKEELDILLKFNEEVDKEEREKRKNR